MLSFFLVYHGIVILRLNTNNLDHDLLNRGEHHFDGPGDELE